MKGFALDLTVRFSTNGMPFLQDHNSTHGTMPFNTVSEVRAFISEEIDRNFEELFKLTHTAGSNV